MCGWGIYQTLFHPTCLPTLSSSQSRSMETDFSSGITSVDGHPCLTSRPLAPVLRDEFSSRVTADSEMQHSFGWSSFFSLIRLCCVLQTVEERQGQGKYYARYSGHFHHFYSAYELFQAFITLNSLQLALCAWCNTAIKRKW